MEPTEYKGTFALEVLTSSLATRLTLDELEWLCNALAQRTEEKRRKEGRMATSSVRPRGANNGHQVADAHNFHTIRRQPI
jgi:CO/xanthine dehydrogenase Mo-binding subunit